MKFTLLQSIKLLPRNSKILKIAIEKFHRARNFLIVVSTCKLCISGNVFLPVLDTTKMIKYFHRPRLKSVGLTNIKIMPEMLQISTKSYELY